jgi:phage shock protein PspC (stress-responsive transcriptional regulator)
MRKVTTINLNNNAYQIDEEGYDALRDYLSAAERNLEGNPDRSEILADLEQAIGDKCRACLGLHKTVVSVEDIHRILAEMGPVEGSAPGAAPGAPSAGTGPADPAGFPFPRRMYRLPEGRMWAGVCTGLAAYFGIDVVWVRVLFVLLTLFTGGVWILIYIAMAFIVPVAETAEERAAAHGAPFNASELINRVKKNTSEMRFRGPRMSRGPRTGRGPSWWAPHPGVHGAPSAAAPVPAPGYAARVTGGILLPVVTVLSAVWFTAMLIAAFAFWHLHATMGDGYWPHGHHGWMGPPHWIAILALIAIWSLIAMPLAAGRRAALYYANGGRPHGWADAWAGVLWFAMVCALFYCAWQFLPGVQEGLRNLLNVTGLSTTLV